MKILFVGSNPSIKAKTYNPFCKSTKSGVTLNSWINIATPQGGFYTICNVSDNPTEANKQLSVKKIKQNLNRLADKIAAINPDKIVALGKTAEKALTLLRYNFYAMPHPSGLNRQLNDKEFVEEKIKGLKNYLESLNTTI